MASEQVCNGCKRKITPLGSHWEDIFGLLVCPRTGLYHQPAEPSTPAAEPPKGDALLQDAPVNALHSALEAAYKWNTERGNQGIAEASTLLGDKGAGPVTAGRPWSKNVKDAGPEKMIAEYKATSGNPPQEGVMTTAPEKRESDSLSGTATPPTGDFKEE